MNEEMKKRCLNNIYFLSRKKGIKISEIESEAGLSAGYISRLNKEGNTTPLNLELVVMAAGLLRVPMECLLSLDYDDMTSTQEYLASFIGKLTADTCKNELRWDCETEDSLNTMQCDYNGNIKHPLFNYIETWTPGETEYPDKIERAVFASRAFGKTTIIGGKCFNLQLKKASTLYVMNVQNDDGKVNKKSVIELWIYVWNAGGTHYLCDSTDSFLGDSIDELYAVLQEDAKHPKMDDTVKGAIDAFMNGEVGGDDDLPF